MGREHSCCFTGHRPQKLPWGFDESDTHCVELKRKLRSSIKLAITHGITMFYTGMAMGTDLWAAEIVLDLREELQEPGIRLVAVIPHSGQESKYPEDLKQRYREIIGKADDTIVLQDHYTDLVLLLLPLGDVALRSEELSFYLLDRFLRWYGYDIDMMLAGRMRQQLKKLADVAAKYDCAIVIIGHMNKTSSEKNLYRGLGSIDIAAIARSVLMISRDKERPEIRYMSPIKTSLAPKGPPIGFCFDKEKGISWLSPAIIPKGCESARNRESKFDLAMRTVSEMLDGTDVPCSEVFRKLKLMGISERTGRSVKKELGILSYKRNGIWLWHYGKGEKQGGL